MKDHEILSDVCFFAFLIAITFLLGLMLGRSRYENRLFMIDKEERVFEHCGNLYRFGPRVKRVKFKEYEETK